MMENIKVLSWFATDYVRGVLKRVEAKGNVVCKDMYDFGVNRSYFYNLQQDEFDKVLQVFKPDIIILMDITSRNLSVDIPKEIKVITFCDHYYEQFCIFGKGFFDRLPENNYLYHIILDAKRIDRDGVLSSSILKDRVFFRPFLPCVEDWAYMSEEQKCDKYICDISVMLRHKPLEYYYWTICINTNHFLGRMLMHFLSELVVFVRNEINQNETAYMEDEYIRRLVLVTMERLHLRQYIRDCDEFVKYWFNEVKYLIIPTEYDNCVVDWLLEKDYNIKIYGVRWKNKKKYEKYAFGEIPDGSSELRKAYRSSKINVSANIEMGIHRRVFEAIENGCLCLQAEAKRSWMSSDWRHYFEDGKNIVIYHDKKELYQKVDYFLSHETERKQIIEAGRKSLRSCPDITDIFGDVIREVYKK